MDPVKRERDRVPEQPERCVRRRAEGRSGSLKLPLPSPLFSAHSTSWEISSPPGQPVKSNQNPSTTGLLSLLSSTPQSATAIPSSHAYPEPELHLSLEVFFPARSPMFLAGIPISAKRDLWADILTDPLRSAAKPTS